MTDNTPQHDKEHPPHDGEEETGAEGGSGSSEGVKAPFQPHEDDDSPLGDSDQHSDA